MAKRPLLENLTLPDETLEITSERHANAPLLAAAALAVGGAAAMWAGSIGTLTLKAVMFVLGPALVALILWEPVIGLCLMVFLVPVEGLYSLAGGWIAITKIVGVLTFACLLSKAQLRQGILRFDRQSKWMLAFAGWVGVSLLWTKQGRLAPVMAMTTLQLALFWVLIGALVNTREELRAVSLYFIAGTVLAIIASAIFPRWGMAPRLVYGTHNPNHLGRDIVVSLVLLMYLAPGARPLPRLGGVAAGGMLMLGLALTQSRASWVGAAVCFPIALWRHQRTTAILATTAMAFVAILMFSMQVLSSHLGVTPSELEYRGETMLNPVIVRGSRVDIWRAGILLGAEHPIVGVGAGAFMESVDAILQEHSDFVIRRGIGAHNSFVAVFAELGLIGLLLFSAVLWNCAKGIAGQAGSVAKATALALFLSAIVQMVFMDAHYQKTIWFTLAVSQILPKIEAEYQ